MASAYPTEFEREGIRRLKLYKEQTAIETQNEEKISKLAEKIIALGGVLPPLDQPLIKPNWLGKDTRVSTDILDYLCTKIAQQNKLIEQYDAFIIHLTQAP